MTMYQSFKLASQGAELAGYKWEVSNPKVVVYLIHGIGEHAGRYDKVGQAFNEAGITMFAMDLRGHGRSPGKRGHIDGRQVIREDIDNLIRYVRERYPDTPLVHYGHSLGGNISLDYRLRGKLSAEPKGYLITSPWVKLAAPIPGPLLKIVNILSKIAPQFTIGQDIKNHMLGDLKLIEKEEDSDLRHHKISLLTAAEGFGIAGKIMENDIVDEYGGGKVPMLLMHGSDDPICDVEGSRRVAENYGEICEYVEWEGYLHELHNGTNDRPNGPVIEKMISWILEKGNGEN